MTLVRSKRIAGMVVLAGIMSLSLYLSACKNTPTQAVASAPAVEDGSDTIKKARYLYGLPPELYVVEEGRVRRNQTLSDLLQPMGLSMQDIYRVSLLPDSLINARKIKQGNRYLY